MGISRQVFVLVALLLAGCAEDQKMAEVKAQLPPPGSNARLFVYRSQTVSQSLSWVPIFLNGATAGGVGPGRVLVCDVAPGTYTIEPKSQGLWPEQAKTVSVAAGQQVYAEIGSFRQINPDFRRQQLQSTFVVTMRDSAQGQAQVGPLAFTPCNAPWAPA